MAARRFVVRGVVQGVGFRFYTLEAARALGLKGFVRNLPDGTVEAWVEGELPAIEKLHGQLLQGPGGARVNGVNAEVVDPTDSYSGFRITR